MVGLGIIFTGLPAAVVLITVATLGAMTGLVDRRDRCSRILGALPNRLINLFENDLLQALPLYVTMGLLLDRLPVADALYRAGNAVLPRRPSAPLVSGMMLGALLGPMNGSVGASVLGLSRVVSPRLAAEGLPAPNRHAMIAVASTLGVLVPPSLVLILLSDAMLSAHTMAVTATGRSDRVVNTQDIFHAALVPGGIFLVLCLALSWIIGRNGDEPARSRTTDAGRRLARRHRARGLWSALLGGVAFGYFYAVEAAAMGAFALLVAGLATGRLRGAELNRLLNDAIALTGALFALLLAATTFTLILRLLGTADLVGRLVSSIPGGDITAVAVILGVIGIARFRARRLRDHFRHRADRDPAAADTGRRCALGVGAGAVDPAVELPAAAVRIRADDGAGRAEGAGRIPCHSCARCAPFLAAQWLLLLLVLLVPQLTHIGQSAGGSPRDCRAAPMSDEEYNKRLNEMIKLPELDPIDEQNRR